RGRKLHSRYADVATTGEKAHTFHFDVDRLAEIGNRRFSGAFRNLVNKWEFSLSPCSKLLLDLIPIDLLPGRFASLVFFQSPIPARTGDAGSAVKISFLW